ncbi:hypothetical protein AAG906_037024 [Vitis piasezkii]
MVISSISIETSPVIQLHPQLAKSVVDLSYNDLTRDVPTWLLDNNTKLEYLSFESNSLTGVLDFRSNSKHFHMLLLDFSSNCIHRELPPFIGSIFPRLEVLNLSGNALQDWIGEFPSLVTLSLSSNHFDGVVPTGFYKLNELRFLYFLTTKLA